LKGFDIMLTTSEKNYLLESMEGLLDEYDYNYDRDALEKIIDEWACQKGGLIEAFKKHPNYIEGKFMIAFDADYERSIDRRASDVFSDWVCSTAIPEAASNFPQEIKDRTGYGDYIPWPIRDFLRYLRNYAERCISESTAAYLNNACPNIHAHAGQKTSRVVNKLCCYLGLDKVDGYNREFAKYADSLSPISIKRHTVLSVNPLDYLTMSFGNSWASCHTIDKENKRNMPNNYSGCYSSGTISYMLDEVSMVLYTVDASYNGKEYWDQPKINRQMFHYGENKLVQARLYPQDNDGCSDVYLPYRNIVQQIMSTILDVPNLWVLKKGTEEVGKYICHNGTNYPDYHHFNSCTVSLIKGIENPYRMEVGARPICIYCGERHHLQENINHCGKYICADCGCYISDDDAIWIDGECYCRDCVHYCDHCDDYHRNEEYYVSGYGWVCEDCAQEYFTYCECCGHYVREHDSYYIDCEDRYVCEDCVNEFYTRCDSCGEYFPNGDIHYHNDEAFCEDCYDELANTEEEVC
jgi:hypothetical protein